LTKRTKLGILTHKDAEEPARKVFGKKAVIGWWGRDERATNVFYEQGCNVLLCVGLPHRNISAIAAERGKAGYKLKALRKAKLDREGKHWTVIKEFADKKLALAVREEVWTAYIQAAGRLRQNRRHEQCYMIVIDTEPLPPELNPEVIPPEEVLPQDILEQWMRKQQRGFAEVNKLKRRAHVEKLIRVAELMEQYESITGEKPTRGWIAKVTGEPERTVAELMRKAEQIREGKIEIPKEWRTAWEIWCAKHGNTFALHMHPLLSPLFIRNVLPDLAHPHLAAAVAFFVTHGYPVPYRALARRFNVHHSRIQRIAQKMLKFMEENGIKPKPIEEAVREIIMSAKVDMTPPKTPPPCPECLTELEPEPSGYAACVGCGRIWKWLEGSWVRVANTAENHDEGFQ